MFLNLETVPHFYKNYVKQIEQPDVVSALRISGYRMLEAAHSIPERLADHRYADGKWSIRELLCHVIDAERIFATGLCAFPGMTTRRWHLSMKTPTHRKPMLPAAVFEKLQMKCIIFDFQQLICMKDSLLKC